MRMVLLRFRPSLYWRRCSAQTRTFWSSSVAAIMDWDKFLVQARYVWSQKQKLVQAGSVPWRWAWKVSLTFSFRLNDPLFVILRAEVTGGAQLGMGVNGIHDFLDNITKGILKSTFGYTNTDISWSHCVERNCIKERKDHMRKKQLGKSFLFNTRTSFLSSIFKTFFLCSFLNSPRLLVMILEASKFAQIFEWDTQALQC